MITENGNELKIFNNFVFDQSLPKYKKGLSNNFITLNDSNVGISIGFPDIGDDITINNNNIYQLKKTFKEKILHWIIKKLDKKNKTQPKKIINVFDFFKEFSKSYKELVSILDISTYYEDVIKKAKISGQIALIEKLESNLDIIKEESKLVSIGLKKYVTEKQTISLYKKVGEDKNLKLTWIKNFGRIIPDDIIKIKKDLDDKEIFDNYVILHYDPENNGDILTKKEIEIIKDPILFGVLNKSRKLYYVADWIDEYCDLTLDEMFTILKDKVSKINNNSIKSYIDNITI
ncbi:MAG TPA: hypothetical protein PLN85_00970 [archaeon]|nr:hypothetical protein [archaeon]